MRYNNTMKRSEMLVTGNRHVKKKDKTFLNNLNITIHAWWCSTMVVTFFSKQTYKRALTHLLRDRIMDIHDFANFPWNATTTKTFFDSTCMAKEYYTCKLQLSEESSNSTCPKPWRRGKLVETKLPWWQLTLNPCQIQTRELRVDTTPRQVSEKRQTTQSREWRSFIFTHTQTHLLITFAYATFIRGDYMNATDSYSIDLH